MLVLLAILLPAVALGVAAPGALAATDDPYYFVNNIGGPGTGHGTFGNGTNPSPYGIAIDSHGYIYALDSNQTLRVHKYAADGTWRAEFGAYGTTQGALSSPYGIAIGSDDTVYVLDTWRPGATSTHRIQKFSSVDGLTYVSAGQIDTPQIADGTAFHLDVDDAGAVYVAHNDASVAEVLKYGSDGSLATTVGSYGTGTGKLISVSGVAVSPDGATLYVCDGHARVKTFSKNGDGSYSETASWDGSSAMTGFAPFSLALAGDGCLWVLDNDHSTVVKLSPAFVGLLSWGGIGFSNDTYRGPWGVAVDAAGAVYVSDPGVDGGEPDDSTPGNHRIARYAQDATPPRTMATVIPLPNANGWTSAASALVTLTADDPAVAGEGHSGSPATQYSLDGALSWIPYVDPVAVTAQGVTTVHYASTDASGNAEVAQTVTVRLDNIRPAPKALANKSVSRNKTVKLPYRVDDSSCPQATVVIKIYKGKALKKTLKPGKKATGAKLTYAYKCKLRRGKYTWKVYATDLAGNTQVKPSVKTLTVK